MAAIDLARFLLAARGIARIKGFETCKHRDGILTDRHARGIARIKGFETISKPHMGLFIRQPRGIARIKGFETGDVGLLEPLVAEPAASPASRALKPFVTSTM